MYKSLSHRNYHICSLQKVDDDPKISEDLPPNARWFRKLARCARKVMLADPRISDTKLHIRSTGAIKHERRRQLFIKKWYIIHPFSIFIYSWRVFFTIYNAFILLYMPMPTFMPGEIKHKYFSSNIHIPMESAAGVDILLKFITGYLHEDTNTIILEPGRIVYNYMKSGLLMDSIAAFPFNGIPIPGLENPETCFLFLKCFRFPVFFNYFSIIIKETKLSYSSSVVLRLIVRSIYLLHWFCCSHYHYAKFLRRFKGYIDRDSWIMSTRLYKNSSVSALQKYATNLNEVLKFITGFRYTERVICDEIIFLIVSMLIGFVYLEYLFCTILALEQYLISMYLSFIEKVRSLKITMQNKRLPPYLREKTMLFVGYKFDGTYYNERLILNSLSDHLRQEIKLYLCENLLKRVKIFKGMPRDLLKRTIMELKLETYMPSDVIVEAGSIGDSMYFISSGTVSVVSSAGLEVDHLQDGAYFGEAVLLFPDQPRLATVTALEITEVYKLSGKDFDVCTAGYPSFKKSLEKIAGRRKTQVLHLDHGYIDEDIENFGERTSSADDRHSNR